jgi:hypothetical protein
MVMPAVCHTKTSTLPGRESWQPREFLVEIFPDKVLIYLIYLATLSTLPSSLRWQAGPGVGNLDRDGRRFVARWDEQPDAFGWTALFGLRPVPERPADQLFAIVAPRYGGADLATARSPSYQLDRKRGGNSRT